jgi:hypothetical protein
MPVYVVWSRDFSAQSNGSTKSRCVWSLVPKCPFRSCSNNPIASFRFSKSSKTDLKSSSYKTNHYDNSDSNQPSTIGDRCHRRRFHDLDAITSVDFLGWRDAVPHIRDRYAALGDRLLGELASALDALGSSLN